MQLHVQHNGQQSGPHSLEEVRAQLASGALQPTDLAWHEGAADWKPLSAIQDLAGSFPPPLATQTSGLAIASMVLGILGFLLVGLTALPAVICGHISLSRIKKSSGALSVKGMAITGLVAGYIGMAFFALTILAGVLIPPIRCADKDKQMQSMNDAGLIYLACKLYASDNGGKFPDNLDQLVPQYLPDRRVLVCPMSTDKRSIGYEYFGGKTTDSPEKILLQSKVTTQRHERLIIRVDGSRAIERE